MYIKDRFLVFTLSLVIIFSLSFTSVFADSNDQRIPKEYQEYYKELKATGKLDQRTIYQLVNYRKKVDQQVLQSLKESTTEAHSYLTIESIEPGPIGGGVTEIEIGDSYSMVISTEGKKGGDDTIGSDYASSYNLSSNTNKASAESITGQAQGWAWTGYRFDITGTGSRSASFSVEGGYIGYLFSSGKGSTASLDNHLRLYDASDGEWVDTELIIMDVVTGGGESQLLLNQKDMIKKAKI